MHDTRDTLFFFALKLLYVISSKKKYQKKFEKLYYHDREQRSIVKYRKQLFRVD